MSKKIINFMLMKISMIHGFDSLSLNFNKLMQGAGKYRQEGKTYVVLDGDIIYFKFNVSGGGKK